MGEQLVKESPNQLEVRDVFREGIMSIEKKMMDIPSVLKGKELDKFVKLRHSFTKGCYIREVFALKGQLIITKIHKVQHPYFILTGDISIMTKDGFKRVKAPHYGITEAGTKRIVYVHEDCWFITVHVTNETDLDKIETEVIAKDFKEIDDLESEKYIEIKEES